MTTTLKLAENLEALRKAHYMLWAPEENQLVLWCVAALQEQAAKFTQPTANFDFEKHLMRQAQWSEKTFGPGLRTKGVCDHIRKELFEVESDPKDLYEWVDVVILALDGAWRCGAKPVEIIAAIEAKQTKNEGRVWPDWKTADPNKAIEHDRSKDAQPTASEGAAAESRRAA